jgi:hypothetical protein
MALVQDLLRRPRMTIRPGLTWKRTRPSPVVWSLELELGGPHGPTRRLVPELEARERMLSGMSRSFKAVRPGRTTALSVMRDPHEGQAKPSTSKVLARRSELRSAAFRCARVEAVQGVVDGRKLW